MVFRNVLIQSQSPSTLVLPPSPTGESKLHSVIGSELQVKHSLSVPYTTEGALRPAGHLENPLFEHSQGRKGKRQKATILTLKALRTSADFVDRDQMQWGVETMAKIIPDKSISDIMLIDRLCQKLQGKKRPQGLLVWGPPGRSNGSGWGPTETFTASKVDIKIEPGWESHVVLWSQAGNPS